jgi:hypothetical protein
LIVPLEEPSCPRQRTGGIGIVPLTEQTCPKQQNMGRGNVPLAKGDSASKARAGGRARPMFRAGLEVRRNIPAGLTPRLALRVEAVPLCEGDTQTVVPN